MSTASAASRAYGDDVILLGPEGSRPFDAASLEGELRAMWRSATAERGEMGGAVYRAALANLVVPVDPERQSRLSPVLAEVMRRHPSRLFLIEIGGPGGAGLRARVTAVCHRREADRGLVCSEQIVLQGDERSGALAPSAVRALLVGDLPMVLLNLQVHPGLDWMEELIQMADLVLEDSWMRERPEEKEAVWSLLARERCSRVHDLAWARLAPWRGILAEVFDAAPMAAALPDVRAVTLEYGGASPPSPAWLLAGWLAARLEWKVVGSNGGALELGSAAGPVRLTLQGVPGHAGRALERIRLQSGPPRALDLEITHRGRDATATVEIRTPPPSHREVAFAYREFAACIVGEIHRHEPNPSLESAAENARRLLRAWSAAR